MERKILHIKQLIDELAVVISTCDITEKRKVLEAVNVLIKEDEPEAHTNYPLALLVTAKHQLRSSIDDIDFSKLNRRHRMYNE